MEDDQVRNYIDVAHTMMQRGEFDAAEKVLEAARDSSLNDAETRKINDFLSHYKKEISKVKHNYHKEQRSEADDGNDKNDNVGPELPDNREYMVLYNSLLMRGNLFTMGIQVFASIPNFRPDVDFNEIQFQLQYLINMSYAAFQSGQYDDAKKHMIIADNLYSGVTLDKQKDSQNNILTDGHFEASKDSAQNKPSGNTDTDSTLKSYKITVIGDDVDVMKCLKIADTALLAKDFKKAERWLQRSERIQPTDFAKQLFKKLEIARREATVAATRPTPAKVTQTAEEAKQEPELVTVTTQQRAEQCLRKAQKAFENEDFQKAKRMISVAQRVNPGIDCKKLQLKLETSESVKQKNEGHEQSDDPLKQHDFTAKVQDQDSVNNGSIGQVNNDEKLVNSEEFDIPEPSYVDSNSETAFASKFDNEYTYRQCQDNVYEYLRKGRTALAKHKFDVAEDFAFKAEELFSTERGKALINDINLAKNLNKHVGVHRVSNDNVFTPKRKHTDNASQTESLKETAKKCLLEFHKEFNIGNWDKAEEILMKTEKLHSSADLNKYLHWVQAARLKQQSEKQFDNDRPEFDSKGSPRCYYNYEDSNKMELDKKQQDKCIDTTRETNTKHDLSTYNLEQEAQLCIESAREECNNGNLDKAELILVKVKELCPAAEKEADDQLRYIQSQRFWKQSESDYNNQKKTDDNSKRDLSTYTLEQEAQVCIESARKECDKGNFDKAGEILVKVKELCPAAEKEANDQLRYIQGQRFWNQSESDYNNQKKSDDREPPQNVANEDQLDKCLNMAEEAVCEGDLEKAEKLCRKAIRMNSNKQNYDITKLISNIREEKEKKIEKEEKFNENIIEANEYLELAERAYNERNLDKAKHLFEKSIKIHQTDYAMSFLCKVETEIEKTKKNTVYIEKNNDDETEKPPSKFEKEIAADELISKALEAIDDKHFYVAESFLNKAEHINSTEHAKEILKTVHANINAQIGASRDKSSGAKVKKQEEFQKAANDYLELASDMLKSGDYVGARQKALVSDCFVPSTKAKELLARIIDAEMPQPQCCTSKKNKSPGKAKKGKNRNMTRGAYSQSESERIFRADKYLEIAEHAFRYSELEKAEEYVKKSMNLNSLSVKAKTLQIEIQGQLNKKKGILNYIQKIFFNK